MAKLQSRVIEVGIRRVHLVSLAKAQRRLIQTVGLMILAYAFLVAAEWLDAPRRVYAIIGVMHLGLLLATVAQTYVVAVGAAMHRVPAALLAAPALIPIVGLVAVFIANLRATRLIEANGGIVGYFGVSKREMIRLAVSSCHRCGYDLRGLDTGVCPECGVNRSPAPVT